jgi:hypothetical protein
MICTNSAHSVHFAHIQDRGWRAFLHRASRAVMTAFRRINRVGISKFPKEYSGRLWQRTQAVRSKFRRSHLQKRGECKAGGTDQVAGESGLLCTALSVRLGSGTLALLHSRSAAGLGAETSVTRCGSLVN